MRRLRWIVWFGVVACGDDGVTGDHPPPPADAAGRTLGDAAGVDAGTAPPRDAAAPHPPPIRDTGAPDGSPMADARAPDGSAAADARLPDAAAPGCRGIAMPASPEPVGPKEICNYRDDDGDDVVDEGVVYRLADDRVVLDAEPRANGQSQALTWAGDGFGIAWISEAGVHFVKVDARGCRVSEPLLLNLGPAHGEWPASDRSLSLRLVGDRFALVFVHERPPAAGRPRSRGTFVQFIDRNGRPRGEPIDLVPGERHDGGAVAAVTDDERLGVFTTVRRENPRKAGVFTLIDREGRILEGPVPLFEGRQPGDISVGELGGMAFDGEAFGSAWETRRADGEMVLVFARWSPDGTVRSPPTIIQRDIRGFDGAEGTVWTGAHHAVPFETADAAWLALVRPDGTLEGGAPVRLHPEPGWTEQIAFTGSELVLLGGYDESGLLRLDPLGRRLAPVSATAFFFSRVGVRPGGPLAALVPVVHPDGLRSHFELTFAGCR